MSEPFNFYEGCQEEVMRIVTQCKENDVEFLRLTYCDTNGIGRCKLVSVGCVEGVLRGGGIGMCCVVPLFDASSKVALLPENEDSGYPDCYVFPGKDTFHLCPWSGAGKARIAQVICSFHWRNSLNYQGIDSRHQCMKQLKALQDEFGYELFSALEYEFVLLEGKQGDTRVFEGNDICSNFVHKSVELFHIEVHRRLAQAGITGRTYQVELGEAQNEITLSPAFGVRAGDEGFILRSCIKETAWDYDKHATFMSKPFDDKLVTNSGHFNHSLWDSDKNNVMYDPGTPSGFSQVAHWWAAGIMKHARALCALVCPTANCYRRIVPGSWAPRKIGWALDRRDAFIRAKNDSKGGTYFECRTPSGAANPYLVIAGIVAAGLDGLRNKLEPAPMGVDDDATAILLPKSLSEAVDAFEQDLELSDMFGEEFMRWYCESKRQTDCKVNTFQEEKLKYWKLI